MSKLPKIAVAMSGGVDSSVAALLLKRKGYDVTGVNMNLWSCHKGKRASLCCSPDDIEDASNVAKQLGIPFVQIDMRTEFKEGVILDFVNEYSAGRTPNPCIRCNSVIKFDKLLKYVQDELGIDLIATGHYARTKSDGNGIHLLKGIDANKDQTYFLYGILRKTLRKIRFPMGCLKKDEARKIAAKEGLVVAEKQESQEVCFIPDGDVAGFIDEYYPSYSKPEGNFVDKDGKKLGLHRGTHAYTIGQRRGLGIGFGDRKYVTEIRPDVNEVVLGDDLDLLASEFTVKDLNIIEPVDGKFKADVKIRYRTPAQTATVTLQEDGTVGIVFDDPVRAITPGQAAVFYDGDMIIGGGWIC